MWFAREEVYGKVVEAGRNGKQWNEAEGQRQKSKSEERTRRMFGLWTWIGAKVGESENVKHVNLERKG